MADETKGQVPKVEGSKQVSAVVSIKSKLIKMKRKYPQHPGGPLTAEVHPDEVENYAQAGWMQE